MNDTPNTDNGSKRSYILKCLFGNLLQGIKIKKMIVAMTDLEMWTFCCIVSVFVSLVSYGIILVKDQMIIQVVKVRVGICKLF